MGTACNRTRSWNLEGEVEAYRSDAQVGTNILSYWQVCAHNYPQVQHVLTAVLLKENRLRYPTIFALAMDIIPIQGSAVPCERIFSSAKETMTARRNRISSELMEALQMMKFSFKRGRGLDFTTGTSKEDELKDMEDTLEKEGFVPEDVPSLIQELALEMERVEIA